MVTYGWRRGFLKQVKIWWNYAFGVGSSSSLLTVEMKALKASIKLWKKEVFGLIEEKNSTALHRIRRWDEEEK